MASSHHPSSTKKEEWWHPSVIDGLVDVRSSERDNAQRPEGDRVRVCVMEYTDKSAGFVCRTVCVCVCAVGLKSI